MQLNIQLNLDLTQAQQLTKLLDSAVRAQGLQVAGAAAIFFEMLSNATMEAQRAAQTAAEALVSEATPEVPQEEYTSEENPDVPLAG